MILGGLETGVTPLEMAHAYNSIAAGGRRLSGTMASNAGGPLGIVEVTDGGDCEGECFQEGDSVPDETGADGVNQVVSKQVISEESAATAREVLSTVVSSGTGKNAATGEPTWGKTGTTDDNGDAWFCGATEEITACVWVGHADTVTPMLTEFAGAPVDGGTFPALIFADVVNAYVALEEQRKAGEDPDPSDEEVTEPLLEESTAPVDEAADPAAAPEETGGGGGGSSEGSAPPEQAAPAPDTGGGAPAAPASEGGIVPG
jgi:penicillin-binding protein 1A